MAKKIPRGLDDKAMLQGYEEEESVEERMLSSAKREEKRQSLQIGEQGEKLRMAGLTSTLLAQLEKDLLQMRLDMFADGVRDYRLEIQRDGRSIIISAKER